MITMAKVALNVRTRNRPVFLKRALFKSIMPRMMQRGDFGMISDFLCPCHWKMSSYDNGKFIPVNQQECHYTNDIYKNNMVREAIEGNGTLRTLQAEALTDKAVNDHYGHALLQEMAVLNNSFLDVINVFNNFIGKIQNH